MASNGWVKLHRELLEKPIWQCSTMEQRIILITLLMMASHKETSWEWQGKQYNIHPGQFVTSLKSIAEKSGSGISIQNVRTALDKLERYEFLTNKSTNKNRLITIVNWELYQSNEVELTSKTTGNQQATNKQLTTIKNDKNEKKNIYSDSFEKFYQAYPNSKGKAQTFKNWSKVIKEHDPESIIESAMKYKRSLKEGTDKAFITTSYNFLGQKAVYLDYLSGTSEDQKPRPKQREPMEVKELSETEIEDFIKRKEAARLQKQMKEVKAYE